MSEEPTLTDLVGMLWRLGWKIAIIVLLSVITCNTAHAATLDTLNTLTAIDSSLSAPELAKEIMAKHGISKIDFDKATPNTINGNPYWDDSYWSDWPVWFDNYCRSIAYRDSCYRALSDSVWNDFIMRYWIKTGWIIGYGYRTWRDIMGDRPYPECIISLQAGDEIDSVAVWVDGGWVWFYREQGILNTKAEVVR
jgi:hypothetical protein